MSSLASLRPATTPVRPTIARPAIREAARIAAKRLAELRHRAAPVPTTRLVWEVADD